MRGSSKLNLFFLECVIGILFFGLASVVILGAFAQADGLRISTKDKIEAMRITCAIAEELRGGNGVSGEKILYYNAGWEESERSEEKGFKMVQSIQEEEYAGGVLQVIKLQVVKERQEEAIWELALNCYIPDEQIK